MSIANHDARAGSQAVNPLIPLALFAGMALFGSSTPLTKIIAAHFPTFSASLLRMALAVLALLPFMVPRWRELKAASARDWTTISLIALAAWSASPPPSSTACA